MAVSFFPGVADEGAKEYQCAAPDSFEEQSEFRLGGERNQNLSCSRSCQTAGGGTGDSGRNATRQNKETNAAAPAAPRPAATLHKARPAAEKPDNTGEQDTNPVIAPLDAATQITRDLGIIGGLLSAKIAKTITVTGVPTIAAMKKPIMTPKKQPMTPNRPPARLVPASEKNAAANSDLFGRYGDVGENGGGS
jgi:hypothetical protein